MGIHHGQFVGVSAASREIIWSGAAFFTMDRSCITDLWVLGEIDAVKRQLGASLGCVWQFHCSTDLARRPAFIQCDPAS